MEKNTVKLRAAFEQLAQAVFIRRDLTALKEALSEALICSGLYPDMMAGRDDLLDVYKRQGVKKSWTCPATRFWVPPYKRTKPELRPCPLLF